MPSLTFIPIFAAALIMFRWGAEAWLAWLNRRHVRAHAGAVPAAFRDTVDDATYAKSVDYTLAKSRFGQFEEGWSTFVLLAFLFSGALALSLGWFHAHVGMSAWADAGWLFAVGVALSLPALPFDWWGQFQLEERFGFNTTTLKTWLLDRAKGLLLAVLLGYPLLVLILKLVGWMGDRWWLWAWLVLLGFQLVMMVLAPVVILPLFNKLTPLAEGSLRERLLQLGERTGFSAKTILVMDGSKRSRHSNAFFTGFGAFRKIVLFDTLIAQLNEPELEGRVGPRGRPLQARAHPQDARVVGGELVGRLRADRLAGEAGVVLRRVRFPGGRRRRARVAALRAAKRDGDVLVRPARQLLVAQARIRGRRLRRAGDGRDGVAHWRAEEADREEPVEPHAAPAVQRVALLASDLAGAGIGDGAGEWIEGEWMVDRKSGRRLPSFYLPSTLSIPCPDHLSGMVTVAPASMVILAILRREGVVAVGCWPTGLML